MRKSVSVVMATYNGEKYIKEQLESIAAQTLLPSEVLIFDDGSKDATVNIIQEFIVENKMENWKVFVNEQNKGWKKNFIDGISEAQGDIIFTADQDDIWHPEKIEIMTSALENEDKAKIAMCNYLRVYNNNFGVYNSTKKSYQWRKSTPRNAEVTYPGCSYAFKREFFWTIRDAWIEDYAHDLLLYIAGWMADVTIICDDILLYFRRHQESATFIMNPILDRDKRVYWLDSNLQVMNKLQAVFENQNCKYVYRRIQWLQKRIYVLNNNRLFSSLGLLSYMRYYPCVRTLLGDFFVMCKGKGKS